MMDKNTRNQALAMLYVQAALRHKETINPEEVAHLYTEGLREISAYLSETDAVDESLETQIRSCAE